MFGPGLPGFDRVCLAYYWVIRTLDRWHRYRATHKWHWR